MLVSCAGTERDRSFHEKIDKYFSQLISAGQPGGAVVVMKDSAIIFSKAYGLADLKTSEPMRTTTLLNIGSITKTFVANGILILQEQGKLSVEDSLLKYFPDFKNKTIGQKVKIKHLLTHTSGLPDNRNVSGDSVFYLTANDAENWYPVTQTDVLEFEPGSRYKYSNPSFNALALIIEQVSGMKWQDFIAKNIFLPAGMKTSTITDGAHPKSGVAHAYTKNQQAWQEDDYGEEPTFCAAGNGGVWSSVEELAKYELALRKATFLNLKSISESTTIKAFKNWSADTPAFIGWSWFITTTPEGLKMISHKGNQGGFAAYYISIPEKKILLVVLHNAPYDVNAFRDLMFKVLQEEKWLD